MQTTNQAQSGSEPVTTATAEQPLDTEAQSAQTEQGAQEEDGEAAAPAGAEEVIAPEQSETRPQTAETSAAVGMDVDAAAKPAVPDTNTNPGSDGQKVKKQEKAGDGRKYVPSKKAMVDPLKMDMSKPLVMPLTSSQLSLQCIECHIIFSDHKSKERHLKLSHPAEYEQCILRNALFACYVCDRHFTNSTELMVHQKAHTEKKPFKCPICSQAFKKSSELTVHKKIHFGQDGYACTDCGKPCKTLTLLKYHRRTHTGERPYVCKECGKRFTMSKALQRHLVLHFPEEAEGEGGDTIAKAQPKKNDGASATKYSCSVCKATFKSSRTRLHHTKTKHNVLAAASNVLPEGQQVKQSTPIITPISICQPALLQVEPNGPLQKVDANIDTEQIRKLIESLGNVQKVNQVVILGQVPPHAPPLEVQQVSQVVEPVNVNLSPPQIDFIGLKQTDSKIDEGDPPDNPYDPMEQTIILEPITPDGQLDNHSFSELGSHIAACESVELTLIPAEQMERHEAGGMHHILQQPEIGALHSNPMEQMVCQNDVDDLKQNLEQTVILELTPALIPTEELEQSQTMSQTEIPSSSLVLRLETPDKAAEQTVPGEQEANLSVPPLIPTVELEQTSLQPEEQDLSSCPVVQPDTLTQAPSKSEIDSNNVFDSQMQTVGPDQVQTVINLGTEEETQKKPEEEPPDKLLVDCKNNLSESENPPAKEKVLSQLQSKKAAKISELPINVMSAQELVKVRKRKPARAFIFQGYMQDFVGSIYQDDFEIDAKPAKRQRTKKPHLVVKFGPQSKDKKSKKQKKTSQQRQPMQEEATRSKVPPKKLKEKKVSSQKKGRKGKKEKIVESVLSTTETKSPLVIQVPQVEQIKEDTRKNKMKKQNEEAQGVVAHISKHKSVASSILTKKKQAKIMQKDQPKNSKVGKAKKDMAKGGKVKKADTPGSNIKQDSLLLLKGHKQPQLKVYKLDPSKASSQASEASPHESHTVSHQTNNNNPEHPTDESTNNITAEGKKKGGRPKKNQKALSLMSSLQLSHQPPEPLPTKPKTTRKRKASSKVETEGVITSHSKRALECKDCGERFSEVSSLQKHKATVHIVESPSLTYTNGNIFEGVSTLDLYQLSKENEKVGVMNAAIDWDTEPEMGENPLEERERSVSFPALIPSPSLPIPPSDVEVNPYEDKNGSKREDDHPSHTSPILHSPSDQIKHCKTLPDFTSESSLSTSTQTNTSETRKPSPSDDEKIEEGIPRNPSSECEVQGTTDEDIKEDLLLEVDLVTVGDQNERDDPASQNDTVPQNESNATCNSEGGRTDKVPSQVSPDTTGKGLILQTVSCSTHQVEIKEEEEETLVQKQKGEGKGAVMRHAARGRRRGTGRLKRNVPSKRVSAGDAPKDSEKQQDYCQVVYEKLLIVSDSEVIDGEISKKSAHPETNPGFEVNKATAPAALLPSIPSVLEESPEDQVVFELESVTTSVGEAMNERGLHGGAEQDKEMDQSPGLILEKFITSRQTAVTEKEFTARNDQEQSSGSVTENEVQVLGNEIKVEENSSNPPLAVSTSQSRQSASVQPLHHRDIRTVLVKEESSLMLNDAPATSGSRHIRWNVEPLSCENTVTPSVDTGERTADCRILPEFNTNQCIFYPVKEEEKEVLVGSADSSRNPEGSNDENQTESLTADCDIHEGSHSAPDYQETRLKGLSSDPGVISDFEDRQAVSDSEWQHPSDLRDFLLQSSDEEDAGCFELSDSQLDSEAEVMAYFYNNPTISPQQPDHTSQSLPKSVSQPNAPIDDSRTREPIDYFSKYFGWDTWVEIAHCTNKLSNMPNTVTAREVACFVGIHIAMGTLKFPSVKLYWEDLTKVPLIAEAMPLPRFLELSRILKLASSKYPANTNAHEGVCDSDQCGDKANGSNGSQKQTDPLWKVQPLLCRFKAGCQSLRREGDYAVDQYPLPLTGKVHNAKLSLYSTALIGFGGLLLHVDLKVDLADKEDAVEKMVPKGSMVFLCKQELSTPVMLERLLGAGVHGAGRVGGARGQIGDEFVSSDGKLMLRRSHCGFILSTAGNGQRNAASLIENFEKAQMSARLNRDLKNLYSIPLTASAPSCWPQAVLWHLTDLALVNSWLLYRQDFKAAAAPLTLMAFRLEVSKALILSSSSDTQDSVPPQPPAEEAHATNETRSPILVEDSPLPDAATRYDGSGHWPEQLGEGEGGRCRFGDCQRTSRVLCLKCCVFLCISRNHNCFLNFHNQGSLGKE